MKKILAVVILAVLIIGCGPQMAKKETLNALFEARAALAAAQAKITDLTSALQTQKADLEKEIAKLEADIAGVQNKIDAHCTKTGRMK